jgi:glycosyltransferase involved in cell wall biosynthesis
VIPLCADERNITPSATFRLNGEFKLLCVARQDAMERYKGFEHIFEALVILRPTHPNIHLNMVGTGDDQVRLKSVTRDLGVADMVTFWGALSDEDLAAAYRECDVYVMPSKKEGFGIVFLEAMRYGKPCIGGNHGGTPDVIEHGGNGYLVEYGDVNTLSTHLAELIGNDARKSDMGNRAKYLLNDHFGYSLFQSRYSDIIAGG